jgi:beta-lactamase regulating signal transducer with metallopeptidase domain
VMAFDFQSLVQISAARALNTIIEGMALAGFSWLVLRFYGGRSAVTRFAVWFLTLLVVVSLPLFDRATGAGALRRPEWEISSTWATGVFLAWAVVAGIMLVRLAGSMWHVWRLRRQCAEMDLREHPDLAETLRQCTGVRRVKLLVSEGVRIPTALGFFRPIVVLPAWALSELSSEELRVVLLHELAHLRRWDDWTNLVQKLLKAVFFFHPAVWWIESRLGLEREMACDDLVLEQTANPQGYAASLVSLAEKAFAGKMKLRRALALAQSALGHMRQTSRRLAQILDPSRTPAKHAWPTLAAIALVSVVVFLVMPYAPEMIGFEHPDSYQGSTSTAISTARLGSTPIRASLVSSRAPEGQEFNDGHAVSIARPAQGRTHAGQPRMVAARANMRSSMKPNVLLAKAAVPPLAEQVLVVVETSRLDPTGATRWTLCVWRGRSGTGHVSQLEAIVMSSI